MNYFAKLEYGQIADIYPSELNIEDFKKAFNNNFLFIDVTNTSASIGDLVNLAGDGSFSIQKGPQYTTMYTVPVVENIEINSYRNRALLELDDLCKNFLYETFTHQSKLNVKISTILEKEALTYKKTGETSKLLEDIAELENISLDEVADQIMQTYDSIIEANAIMLPYYCKWKTYINKATSVPQLREIIKEMCDENLQLR